MKILITGSSGYIGQPLSYKLKKAHDVIGVDNYSRVEWVKRINPQNIASYGDSETIIGNLTDKDFVDEILKLHRPDVIIHLASQPSMPYSQLSWERALFTQLNNISMNLNLLWGIKENGLKTRYIITTTTGIPGQTYDEVPEDNTLNMAGSWYHVSRGFDSDNCNLASRQFNIQVIEFRTSIVYGLQTKELKEKGFCSRFDTDSYFGTVLNRFVKQAIEKKPLTIYGEGNQTKPFISLWDCCESIAKAVDYDFGTEKHIILNQTTECISIATLANLVAKFFGTTVEHIPNPRKEKEDFDMWFKNDKFMKLLGTPNQLIGEGLKEMERLLNYGR